MKLFDKKSRFSRARRAHIRFGIKGETLACRLIRNIGMEILDRNYAGPHGEIDIIARDGSILSFIEVKTRRKSPRSRPADAVTAAKKEHIIKTAHRYLTQLGSPAIVHRFDIVEVIFNGRRLIEIRYWPNEFSRIDCKQYNF